MELKACYNNNKGKVDPNYQIICDFCGEIIEDGGSVRFEPNGKVGEFEVKVFHSSRRGRSSCFTGMLTLTIKDLLLNMISAGTGGKE